MLEGLLGNKSAEKVMLALYQEGELHASAIAQKYNTSLDPIKKQLERFEEAGFLVSRLVGRSRLYSFNDRHPLMEPLRTMLKIAKAKDHGEGKKPKPKNLIENLKG